MGAGARPHLASTRIMRFGGCRRSMRAAEEGAGTERGSVQSRVQLGRRFRHVLRFSMGMDFKDWRGRGRLKV
jgi:hypothetical protein